MKVKHSALSSLAALVFACACAASASAQTVQISGKVTLKQADGTTAPVEGALIDIYRTDVEQQFEARTNERGEYAQARLPAGGKYIIAVSAPDADPDFAANLLLGQRPRNDFALSRGDGHRLTSEEIKEMLEDDAVAEGAPDAAAARGKRLARARELFDENRYRRAERQFRRVLAEEPNNLDALVGLPGTIYRAGNHSKFAEVAPLVERFISMAPRSHPSMTEARMLRARLRSRP